MPRRRMQQPSRGKGWHVTISSSTTDSFMRWRWSWFLYHVPLAEIATETEVTFRPAHVPLVGAMGTCYILWTSAGRNSIHDGNSTPMTTPGNARRFVCVPFTPFCMRPYANYDSAARSRHLLVPLAKRQNLFEERRRSPF